MTEANLFPIYNLPLFIWNFLLSPKVFVLPLLLSTLSSQLVGRACFSQFPLISACLILWFFLIKVFHFFGSFQHSLQYSLKVHFSHFRAFKFFLRNFPYSNFQFVSWVVHFLEFLSSRLRSLPLFIGFSLSTQFLKSASHFFVLNM